MSCAAAANALVPVVVGAAVLAGGDVKVGFAANPMDAKMSSSCGFGGCGFFVRIDVLVACLDVPKLLIFPGGSIAGAGADTGAGATRVDDTGELSSSQSSQSKRKYEEIVR